jgi:hypothetical protein
VLSAVAALLMLFYVPPVLPPVLPPIKEEGPGLPATPADGLPAPTTLPRRDPGATLGEYPPAG